MHAHASRALFAILPAFFASVRSVLYGAVLARLEKEPIFLAQPEATRPLSLCLEMAPSGGGSAVELAVRFTGGWITA
ncbi:hypothetical protein V8C43DRAFT_269453 [Trichoderma afarasin]